MRVKILNEAPERTYAVIFSSGERVMRGLEQVAREHSVTAARFTAIGALSSATLGYFDWQKKDYLRIAVDEQVEVLSLVGDVAMQGSKPIVHAHAVLGRWDGSTRGGHVLEAHVRPTLEVVLVESPNYLARVRDAESGLALIRIGE
ncbi:MAG: PPC domain-containing DNA-binding protein [Steroidobacteraceae bacterium]